MLLRNHSDVESPAPFRKLLLRRDVDLVLHAADVNYVSQIPRFTVDLDPLFEEDFLLDIKE